MAIGRELSQPVETALLSAVAIGDDGQFLPATTEIFGTALISLQINSLREIGVKRFFIEAEQLTGPILSLVDELKAEDIDVAMVRSPKDLADSFASSDRCLVLAPGIHVEADIISNLINQPKQLVATVDGRDESSAFERIDLNTRWAGLAVIDKNLIEGLADLPEGWSLTSAILRGALQSGLKQQPIDQREIDSNALQVIDSQNRAEQFKRAKLQNAAKYKIGLVEEKIYAPIVQWLALRFTIDHRLFGIAAAVFALIAVVFGLLAIPVIAVLSAAIAVFLTTASDIIFRIARDKQVKVLSLISWGLLAIAMVTLAIQATGGGAFAAAIAGGLLIYSSALGLQKDMRRYLPSPALLSLALIAGAIVSEYGAVFQIFVLLQVAAAEKNATQLKRP